MLSRYFAVESKMSDRSHPCFDASFIRTVAFLIRGKSILSLNSIRASLKFIPQLMWDTSSCSS